MTGYDIAAALGEVSDGFICEAADWGEHKGGFRRRRLRRAILALAAALALLTTAALGTAAGRSYLAEWFASGATKPAVWQKRGAGGVVADTEELRIEAVDALRSGHMVSAAFLVTLKNLPSALDDGGYPTLPGYMFENVSWNDGEARRSTTLGHYYADKYPELAENQFLFVTTYANGDDAPGALRVHLQNIGRFDTELGYVPLYEGDWEWTFPFSGEDAGGFVLTPGDTFRSGELSYRLEKIRLSALGVEVTCALSGREELKGGLTAEEVLRLFDAADLSVTLRSGETLALRADGGETLSDEGYWNGTVVLTAIYDSPVAVSDVSAVTVFGSEHPVSP